MSVNLRQKIQNDIFDYVQLTDALSDFSNIRTKIGRLLASGEIIRIKKGLYTFPEYLRHSPLNPCIVANMLYGPSYVSCDYALSFHGMIPERVELITSMTTSRSKSFSTPIGCFSYYQRKARDYSIGVESLENPSGNCLMASREKAIYDKALSDPRFDGSDIREYLLEDLRLDETILSELNHETLHELQISSDGRMLRLVNFLLKEAA
ncbi:MAG: hypothetical protein IJJ33_09885 [Victivallales bacterium]|nr:hypothetical protein [Victivallales bacterium]